MNRHISYQLLPNRENPKYVFLDYDDFLNMSKVEHLTPLDILTAMNDGDSKGVA